MGSVQRQRDLTLSCCEPALPSNVHYKLSTFTPAGKPPMTEAVSVWGQAAHTPWHSPAGFSSTANNRQGGQSLLFEPGVQVWQLISDIWFSSVLPLPCSSWSRASSPSSLSLWLEGIAVIPLGLARPALKHVIQIEGIQHIDRQIFSM